MNLHTDALVRDLFVSRANTRPLYEYSQKHTNGGQGSLTGERLAARSCHIDVIGKKGRLLDGRRQILCHVTEEDSEEPVAFRCYDGGIVACKYQADRSVFQEV